MLFKFNLYHYSMAGPGLDPVGRYKLNAVDP
jgi:hypothetical protein